MTQIAIIDPHVVFRQLLCGNIRLKGGAFTVVAESALGGEAFGLCEKYGVDLLLLDCGVTDLTCTEVVLSLRTQLPLLRVLLVASGYSSTLREAVNAGAHGCVLKTESLDDFYAAMKIVSSGGAFFSARLPALRPREGTRLTPRQNEVLGLIASGLSTKEVADRLAISFKTADHHRTRLMKKLNVHDVTSLVRYAIRHGLTEV